ncbi:hypothetical protein QQ045_016815 [Rhodiola kirilowii]
MSIKYSDIHTSFPKPTFLPAPDDDGLAILYLQCDVVLRTKVKALNLLETTWFLPSTFRISESADATGVSPDRVQVVDSNDDGVGKLGIIGILTTILTNPKIELWFLDPAKDAQAIPAATSALLLNETPSIDRSCKEFKLKAIVVVSLTDEKQNTLNFITEVCTSGDLRQYRRKHRHVSLKALKKWCWQILKGLEYLHTNDLCVINRDLNCSNVFINGNTGVVKISDFGLAVVLGNDHVSHSMLGTPEFMAPEVYEENYNELVDIYSNSSLLFPYAKVVTLSLIGIVGVGLRVRAVGELQE